MLVRILRIALVGNLLAIYSAAAALGQPISQQLTTPASAPDRELIVATKEAPPFAMKGPDGTWQGISLDLLAPRGRPTGPAISPRRGKHSPGPDGCNEQE